MAEDYINAQRQARAIAQDFLAANPRADQVSVSHGGVRLTIDKNGREHADRVCTGCAHDLPGNCAAATRDSHGYVRFPEEPCFQSLEAA